MSADLRARYFFQQRQRNRLYETVLKELQENGVLRKDLAEKLGVSPSQISHWLSGPSNWTIDTVSDLMFAVGSEMDFSVSSLVHKPKGNRAHVLNVAKIAPKAAQLVPTTKNSVPTTVGDVKNLPHEATQIFGRSISPHVTVTIKNG